MVMRATAIARFRIVPTAFSLAGAPALAQSGYSLVELPPPSGGAYSIALGINDMGLVVGNATDAQGRNNAVYWDAAGEVHVLVGLPPDQHPLVSLLANAVNNQGVIVGTVMSDWTISPDDGQGNPGQGDPPKRWATFWLPGEGYSVAHKMDLLTPLNFQEAVAQGINSHNQVVGWYGDAHLFSPARRGFLYDIESGTMVDIGGLLAPDPFGGQSGVVAYAINDAGQIAGMAQATWMGNDTAFRREPGGTFTILHEFDEDAGQAIGALCINARGDCAGSTGLTRPDGTLDYAAAVWSGNGIARHVPSAAATSYVFGINSVGQSVGTNFSDTIVDPSTGQPGADWGPWLSDGRTTTDLNMLVTGRTAFADLGQAKAINERGQIVGLGRLHTGEYRAFLLTPPGAACSADFNGDGDAATDADIEAFFACMAGACCPTCGSADFNGDGDAATDADIEAFFRVLAGGAC
jgi:probable HAF family extracellular repeat protein